MSYAKGHRFELFVCGTPSREWLEWVRTTAVPLTSGQVVWREIAQDRVDQLGRVEPRPPLTPPEPPARQPEPAPRRRSANQPGRRRSRQCPHQYTCDQCGHCERCGCYDCDL